MTTNKADKIQTTNATSNMTASLSYHFEFYFTCAVVTVGAVGTAINSLILYAMIASKQHKKHLLIANQIVMDLFTSFCLMVSFAVKLCNLRLTGRLGYWLCMLILSEALVSMANTGSVVNLAAITADRYLKVVHPVWSRKRLRPWMMYSAVAFAWFVGAVYHTTLMFKTSAVVDGVCYGFVFYKSNVDRAISGVLYISFFYVIILVIFIFCYGRILVSIRRQAGVMAGHSAARSNSVKNKSNKMQSSVIKTMMLVCMFYAATRLPLNGYIIIMMVDPDKTQRLCHRHHGRSRHDSIATSSSWWSIQTRLYGYVIIMMVDPDTTQWLRHHHDGRSGHDSTATSSS